MNPSKNRRWWRLTSDTAGGSADFYHRIEGNSTACGIKLPEVYAKCTSATDRANPWLQKRKRCLACVDARKHQNSKTESEGRSE